MSSPSLITELEDQFAQNPRRVFARLANEYRKSGDVDRAIEICRAHVPQQPGYISGYIVLGQALYESGQLEESRQTFETALTLDPENLIALRQLGDIARDQLDLDQARAWYRRLLEVDPQNEEVAQQLDSLFTSSANVSASSPDSRGADEPAPDGSAGSFFSFAEIGHSDEPARVAAEPQSERDDDAVVLPLRHAEAAAGEPDGHMVELTSSAASSVTRSAPTPPAATPSPTPAAAGATGFVTETMAELYLQQGFRERALEIYRQLRDQNPGSAALRERVRQLESGEGGRSNGKESIRDFFAGLTTRRPTRRTAAGEGETPHEWALPQERMDAGTSPSSATADPTRGNGLLGATAASAQDEAAASALASAFVDPPREDVSFDDFFAPPQPPSADAPGADRDPGDRADEASESDLASFHAWLAGLKK